MHFDKREIALSVGGILATGAIAYLIYRLEKNNAAIAQQQEQDNANAIQSQLANQQQEIASLPSISVPTISSTPASLPTATTSGDNSVSSIEAIVAAFQSQDNSHVTSAISPIASLGTMPLDNILPIVAAVSTVSNSPAKATPILGNAQ